MKEDWPIKGVKYDGDKLPFQLMPWDAVEEVCKVLQFGAKKYAPRNWESGFAWYRPWSAGMRHMTRWWLGEDNDQETGLSHIAHACCCMLFILAFIIRRVGVDDRPSSCSKASNSELNEKRSERSEDAQPEEHSVQPKRS